MAAHFGIAWEISLCGTRSWTRTAISRGAGTSSSRRNGAFDATRCVHPDRQQRLADLHHLTTVQTELRSEPHDRRKGRALRLRLRAVDDQTARLRRTVGILGLQPG